MKNIALIISLMLALFTGSASAQIVGGGGSGGGGTITLPDCPSSLWASLPGSPTTAQCFYVTNAASCVAGTPVTTSGSTGCTLTWTGSNWVPAGNATSAATGGVTSVALAVPSQFTVSGSPITSSGTITLGYTANSLAAHNFGTGISVNGLLTGAQPGAADISAGTFGGAFTFSTAPTMSGANITSATIPDASLVTTPLLPANNLSDVSSASTSRTNLGLGTAATVNTGTSGATLGLLNGNLTFGGTDTFSNGPTMSGANISSATIPSASLVNTAVTAGSYTNTNLTVNAEGQITAATNGSGGSGSNPIFTHTLTAGSSATMVVNSGTVAAIDKNYEAPTGNGTWTFPAAMADGEIIYFNEQLSGTAYSNTFAKGTLVTTFASDVTGDTNTAPGTPAACGTVPSTGDAWFAWHYTAASTKMTLLGCGIDPPGATIGVVLGGTGLATLTSHAVEVGAGTSAITQVGPDSTSGQPLLSQGSSSDPAFGAVSLSGSGVTGTLPIANGGTNSTTGGLLTTTSTNSNVFGVGFDFIGTPTASMIEAKNLVYEMSVPANYATPTSSCTCGTNPSETDAYTIKCNGTSEGTFSLSTSCVLTLPTNSAYTCTAGQRFEMDAPATVSGKDIACTVAYTR